MRRFLRHLLVLFLIHTGALSMYRCVASYCQTMVGSTMGGTMLLLLILLFGGFIIPRCKAFPWFHGFKLQARYSPSTIKQKFPNTFLGQNGTASMPNWLKWGFWLSPLSYAEIGLTGNEFLAPRWLKVSFGIKRIFIDNCRLLHN